LRRRHLRQGRGGLRDLGQFVRGRVGIGEGPLLNKLHAATSSFLSGSRITILSASSGNGRCNAFASSHGAQRAIHLRGALAGLSPDRKPCPYLSFSVWALLRGKRSPKPTFAGGGRLRSARPLGAARHLATDQHSAVIRKQLDWVGEAAHRILADAFEIEIAFDEVGERAGQQHCSPQLFGEGF
jgi:hypothetical protein